MSLIIMLNSFRTMLRLLPVIMLAACSGTQTFTTIIAEKQPGKPYIKPAYTHALPKPLTTSAIPISEYHVPRFSYYQLTNGVQVYLLKNHKLPQISIAALVEAGSKTSACGPEQNSWQHDSQYLAPLVVKLLKRGTRNYSEQQFEKLNSQLGTGLKYSLNARFAIITANIFPYDISRALALLSDSLSASQVGMPAETNNQETILQEAINQQLIENRLQQSSGRYWIWHRFYQDNYPLNHPYHEVDIDPGKIKNTPIKELRHFYKDCYTPANTRLVIAGDIQPRALKTLVHKYFSHWSNPSAQSGKAVQVVQEFKASTQSEMTPANPGVVKTAPSKVTIIHRAGAQQANVLFARVTVAGQSADYIELLMLARLLGGGPGSRLFTDLRERQGLTYAISAQQLNGLYRQPFYIQTSVAHDKLTSMISGINSHLDYLCKVPVSADELEHVKQQMSGELILNYQTNKDFINNKIKELSYNSNAVSIKERLKKINSVSTDSLFRVMQQYLCGQRNYYIAADQDKLGDLKN